MSPSSFCLALIDRIQRDVTQLVSNRVSWLGQLSIVGRVQHIETA